jgi:hypothetical protein
VREPLELLDAAGLGLQQPWRHQLRRGARPVVPHPCRPPLLSAWSADNKQAADGQSWSRTRLGTGRRASKSREAIRRRRGPWRGFTRPHGPNARARRLKSRRPGEGAMRRRPKGRFAACSAHARTWGGWRCLLKPNREEVANGQRASPPSSLLGMALSGYT